MTIQAKDLIDVCRHERVERHRAEPDVGIMLPYWECRDCGDTTTDWEDVSDEDGRGIAPVFSDVIKVDVPDGYWIVIDRLYPSDDLPNVVIGPFVDEAVAMAHLEDSMQVQSICEDDAEDAYLTNAEGAAEAFAFFLGEDEPVEQYEVVEDLP